MSASRARLFPEVSRPGLLALARALGAGSLRPPYTGLSIGAFVDAAIAPEIAERLHQLAQDGFAPAQLARLLGAVAAEREAAQALNDRLELVWSGPEQAGAGTRDTAVVVPELFGRATRSVLLATYALDSGEKARAVLEPLAERMDAVAELEVAIYLSIVRKLTDARPDSELVREFGDRFRNELWPGGRLPEVFYDPRALELGEDRACLHAKCIVVDQRWALVTSANLTEAAQRRNFEAGVLVEDPPFCRKLEGQFRDLATAGMLRRLG